MEGDGVTRVLVVLAPTAPEQSEYTEHWQLLGDSVEWPEPEWFRPMLRFHAVCGESQPDRFCLPETTL